MKPDYCLVPLPCAPANTLAMTNLAEHIAKRRTFAIIAHPDAGKTTLTEKLLLFGGAIQMAGMVKAKGDRRRAKLRLDEGGAGARAFP